MVEAGFPSLRENRLLDDRERYGGAIDDQGVARGNVRDERALVETDTRGPARGARARDRLAGPGALGRRQPTLRHQHVDHAGHRRFRDADPIGKVGRTDRTPNRAEFINEGVEDGRHNPSTLDTWKTTTANAHAMAVCPKMLSHIQRVLVSCRIAATAAMHGVYSSTNTRKASAAAAP